MFFPVAAMGSLHRLTEGGGAVSRATPSWVAYTSAATRVSQSGGATTPDNTADGDLIIGLDGRTNSTLPDLAAGATEIANALIGSGASLRIWYKFITAGETIPATANANRRLLLPYRNVDPSAPILAFATPSATTGVTGTIPALSTFAGGAQGLVVAGYLHDNATADQTLGAPLTQRGVVATGSSPNAAGDSTALVTSFAAQNFTITADAFIGYALALLGKVV